MIPPSTPWLEPLASWCASLDGDAMTPAVRGRIRDAALDWWGAFAAGTAHPLAPAYREALGGGTDPLAAAPLAAAISHLLEVDDGDRLAMMHPGVTVMPVVLALAQSLDLTAAEMRSAIVAGYEAGLRVGTLLGKDHYACCHVTATAGGFGAAAAACRALRLSPERTLWAFGHAGTQAAGLWEFLDDGAGAAKAFHPAAAVRNGIAAARLARAGIPGAECILEGPRGMLRAWGLSPAPDAVLAPGSEPWRILTVTVKSWPVCGQMHSALDALRDILHQIPVAPFAVERVEIEGPKAQMDIAARTEPATFEEAKFSTAFCAAFLLLEGSLDFANFTPAALSRADVRELAARIAVGENPALTARFPAERPARVRIFMQDGRVLTAERAFRRGDPEAPWTFPEMVDRFDTIAAGLDRETRRAVIAWTKDLAEGNAPQGRAVTGLFARIGTNCGESS